ncbi:MAG: T9SS type A sorting domain-containing protein [Bacteroidia bacterium]
MKSKFYPILLLILFQNSTILKAQIDLTTGGNGTTTGVSQSYNETRAADITILSHDNLQLTSMSLRHFWSGADGNAIIGARIYDVATMGLIYSHDTTVFNFFDATLRIPASATLLSGHVYRIGFYCSGSNSDNSALMYQPTFPYNDMTGMVKVNFARQNLNDIYPDNMNIFVPFISFEYEVTTGIEGNFSNIENQVYPNPFSGEIHVNTIGSDPVEFNLYDMCSRKILHENITSEGTIRTDKLSKGVYFYKSGKMSGFLIKE